MNPNRLNRLFEACPDLKPAEIVEFFEAPTGFTDESPKAWFPHAQFIDPAGQRIRTCISWGMAHNLIERQILAWLTMRLAEMGGALVIHHLAGRFHLTSAYTPMFASASLLEACVCAAEWVKELPKWTD